MSNSNAAAPTLDIQSTGGIANVFSGPANPPMGASYFTIEVNGGGFPAGESSQSMLIAVRSGGKTPLSTGIGQIPPDGTHREIYSASCPSGFSEVYSVVQTGGRTTESKHIVPAC